MTTPEPAESAEQTQAYCQEISRRQRYTRAPQKIADVVSGLLARRGYAQVQTHSQLHQAWEQAAGKNAAQSSRAGKVRRGVLEVMVANSALLQELSFQKKQILKKLKQLAPDQKIRDLRFRVGDIR